MTVSTTTSTVTQLGNGSTTVWNFPFIGVAASDIQVTTINSSGVATVLTPSQYTLTINPVSVGQLWGIGGTVTYPKSGPALAVGNSIAITRLLPYTQTVSIADQGNFYPQVVEQALDLVDLQVQQINTAQEYSIQVPVTDVTPPAVLPSATARENSLLGFNAQGSPVVYPLNTPVIVQAANYTPTFTSQQVAATSPINGLEFIFVQGYYTQGDGGHAYWKQVTVAPNHSAYFTANDGSIWELWESEIDPRMLGARANGWVFTDGLTTNANLSLITLTSNSYAFTTADIGKSIVIWDYGYVNQLANTTIASVSGNTCTLTAPCSSVGAFSGVVCGYFGSDDSVAIAAALSTTGPYIEPGTATPPNPPTLSHSGNSGAFLQGTRTVRLKSYDRLGSMYCVSSPVRLSNKNKLVWDDGALLIALGNFSGESVISQIQSAGVPLFIEYPTVENAQIDCMGIAPLGIQFQYATYLLINSARIYTGLNGGIQLGVNGNSYHGDISSWCLSGKIHCEAINTTKPGYVNQFTGTISAPTSGIGLWISTIAADGVSLASIECVSYRTGIFNQAVDAAFSGSVHCWTNTNGGYMTAAVINNSSDSNFTHITADSPWNTSGQPAYGFIAVSGNYVSSLECTLNVAATGVTDNQVTAVYYLNANAIFGKLRIDNLYTSSNNSSVKLAQIVDASLASSCNIEIGTLTTDGNYHDIGLDTQTSILAKKQTTSAYSNASLIYNPTNWTPAAGVSGTQVVWWLDASQSSSPLVDGSNNVQYWNSRLGNSKAVQTNSTFRPALSTSTWTSPTMNTVNWNGTSSILQLDDIISGQTDVRIFCTIIPTNTGTAFGPIFGFNNPPNFGGLLRIAGHGTAITFSDRSSNGNSVTVTPGTQYLVTGIWSSTSSEATGMFGRLNGGTNTAAVALAESQGGCTMGGFVASNAVSQLCSFDIGEFIVVTGPMTLAQEQLFEGYLAWKWFNPSSGHSPALPNTHPYYTSPPLVGPGLQTATANAGNSYTVTVNGANMAITTDSLTKAAGTSQAITINYEQAASTSLVLVTQIGGTNTGGLPTFTAVPGSGTVTLTIANNAAATAAFNGTFILAVQVIN